MALTPRVETYGDTAAATSLACNVPASTANGDLMFMWIGLNNASSYVVNGGVSAWTLLGSYTTNADKYYLYARVAASEPASYTPTFSGSTKARIVMSCYIASSDFISAIPTLVSNTAYRTSNTTVQAAQLTTIKANQCLVLWAGAYYTTAVKTFTKPSTQGGFWVENDDAGNANSDFALEVCSGIWSGSGATGVINSTMSSGNIATKHAFAVALPTNVPITPTVGAVTAAGVAGVLGLALLSAVGATSLAGYAPSVQIAAPPVDTPITPSAGSMLLGPPRTNLITYSEQLDNAIWGTYLASVTPNAATAPDGTLSADFLDFSAGVGAYSNLYNPVAPITIDRQYVFSVWLWADGANIGRTVSIDASPAGQLYIADLWRGE